MKVWSENSYIELAEAYKKGMPAEKIAKILERQRKVDSRGAEVAFWNELNEQEAEEVKEAQTQFIVTKETDSRGRFNLGSQFKNQTVTVRVTK